MVCMLQRRFQIDDMTLESIEGQYQIHFKSVYTRTPLSSLTDNVHIYQYDSLWYVDDDASDHLYDLGVKSQCQKYLKSDIRLVMLI